MFKRIASAFFVSLFVVASIGCDVLSNPTSPGRAVVASGHPEWSPIMYRSGEAIEGAGPALVQRIFDDLDIDVTFPYTGTWDEVQAKARTGEVDVLVAAYKTSEREGYMIYSDAYTTDPVAIFVASGNAFPFTDWNVLVGKRGVAMVGDSYGQAFDDFAAANLQLTRATSAAQAFDLVASGQADYLLYALYSGDDYLKQAGATAAFESLPTFVNEENFYITISRASRFARYMPEINAAIARYKADGTIAALIAQYKQ